MNLKLTIKKFQRWISFQNKVQHSWCLKKVTGNVAEIKEPGELTLTMSVEEQNKDHIVSQKMLSGRKWDV